MISMLLLTAAVTAAQPFRVEGAADPALDQAIQRALNAPERPRVAGKTHYCVRVESSDPARTQVCRTERDWRRLGLIPLVG